MRRPLLLILAAAAGLGLGLDSPTRASEGNITFDPESSVGFPSLGVPVGVRATGMGEAYTAVADDVYALHWNPAGLSRLSGYQLGLSDNQWNASLGLTQNLVTYGQGINADSGAALSFDYFGLGSLQQRDASGNLLGSSSASVMEGSLGYGLGLLAKDALRAGLSLEFAQQSLYGSNQDAFGLGAGLLYELLPDLTAGASLQHVGLGSGGFDLPADAQAGLAWRLKDQNLLLSVEGEQPFSGSPQLKGGAEYTVGVLALRAGYRQTLGGADESVQSGFSAGAGFKVGYLRVDYSYTPYGDLSTVQRIEATVSLPNRFFEPKVVMVEGTSETAKSYYVTAQGLEAKGQTLPALMQYLRCVENYPSSLKAAPQPFYSDAVKKVASLQSSLTKGGDHTQIHKLTLESMAVADQSLKEGRFKEAIERLNQALKVDPLDPDLQADLKRAQDAFQAKLSTFRDAARFGANENDLAMSVDNYRKLLAVDPEDAEALAYLTKHRKDLKTLLEAIDRRAVYFFVGGKLDEAIKAWTDGENINYFGDVDLNRNLDKARKQKELLNNEQPTPTP